MKPLALVLLVSLSGTSAALAAPVLEEGARVRITLIAREPAPQVGRVLALPPEAILFAADADSSQREIPRTAIAKLEVSEGMHSNAGNGAISCALLFSIPGAVLGLVAGAESKSEGGGGTAAGGAAAGFVVGAVGGAAVGALFGSFGRHERWRTVEP